MQDKVEAVLEAGRLRVTFIRTADRIHHLVALADDPCEIPILASVEGSAAEDWPASPPFQSLHVERPSTAAPRVLLVGMAGKSHWSASVEADVDRARIHFDIACRVHAPSIDRLGVEYRAIWPLTLAGDGTAQLASPQPTGDRLSIEPSRSVGPTRIMPTSCGLSVVPTELTSGASSRTQRWAYTLAFDSDSVR